MAGAAGTLTYRFPPAVAGGAVAPTLAQMAGPIKFNSVVVDVAMPDNAIATPVVHNMALPGAGTGLDGTPKISVVCLVAGGAPATLIVAFTDLNTISLTQSPNTVAGNGCTWRVTIERPNTIVQ